MPFMLKRPSQEADASVNNRSWHSAVLELASRLDMQNRTEMGVVRRSVPRTARIADSTF